MRTYYYDRFKRLFTYTSRNFFYCVAKTLCIIIGLPLFVVLIPVDFLIYLVYAIFSWIPYLNMAMLFLCRILSFITGIGYFISVIPDAKKYMQENKQMVEQAEREQNEQFALEADENESNSQDDINMQELNSQDDINMQELNSKEHIEDVLEQDNLSSSAGDLTNSASSNSSTDQNDQPNSSNDSNDVIK